MFLIFFIHNYEIIDIDFNVEKSFWEWDGDYLNGLHKGRFKHPLSLKATHVIHNKWL